jgi:MSHA biogenesis protein MshJ
VKMPPALDAMLVRFDRLSLRERLLIFVGSLAVAIIVWQVQFMDRLNVKEKSLTSELTGLQESVASMSRATQVVASVDRTAAALKQLQERQKSLDAINAKLTAESAGLIPPAQMVQVIHDVLRHQDGLTLVTLRNLPVRSLVPETKNVAGAAEGNAGASPVQHADVEGSASAALPATAADSGPYLHPVELVIEGRYLDIVAYLRALEGLPWRFYWRVLQLETKTYPLNRVRIELSTLSLDKEWIGV